MVHYVERGSIAEFNEVEKNDVLDVLDGKTVATLSGVYEQLAAARSAGRPVSLIFKRLSGGDALFSHLERNLRVTGLGWIGPEAKRITR